MSSTKKSDKDDAQFSWGEKGGLGTIQYYKSFIYDNEEYFLYDCVYIYEKNQTEPYIGKILKIWEDIESQRKVQVLWFFHPNEVKNFIESHRLEDKEIFLASGEGLGLSNVIQLEALNGKCCVVCTSKDQRNPQPSDAALEKADFIFFRTFDVKKYTISSVLPDKIAGIDVSYLLNHQKYHMTEPTKGEVHSRVIEVRPSKRLKLSGESAELSDGVLKEKTATDTKKLQIDYDEKNETNPCQVNLAKSPKPSIISLQEQSPAMPVQKGTKADEKLQLVDKRKWFKVKEDDKFETADYQGRLVLLENLNPALISTEIEDIMFQSCKEKCSAKVFQQASFQNSNYGRAYLIFDTRKAAELVTRNINDGCLMLHGRPLISSVGMLKVPGKTSTFPGHLPSYKRRPHMQHEDMRKAVSTSHFAQPNTIEFWMAVEWVQLQKSSLLAQKMLHKEHNKELTELLKRPKVK